MDQPHLKGQRLLVFLAILAGLLALPGVARADEIALWNFNDANVLVDRGAGTLTTTATPTDVISSTGLSLNAQMGDPAGFSLAIQGGLRNQNNGSILDLHVSTVVFDSIGFSIAVQRTSTGFNLVTVQYSSDGINFNPFLSTSIIPLEPGEGGIWRHFRSVSRRREQSIIHPPVNNRWCFERHWPNSVRQHCSSGDTHSRS